MSPHTDAVASTQKSFPNGKEPGEPTMGHAWPIVDFPSSLRVSIKICVHIMMWIQALMLAWKA